MKKLAVGVMLMLLVGCNNTLTDAEIKRAQNICSSRGGVSSIYVNAGSVQCYDLKYYTING